MKNRFLAILALVLMAAPCALRAQVAVAPKMYLQGPFSNGTMSHQLSRLYDREIASAVGAQQLPANTVDVVTVALVKNNAVVFQQTALLLADGRVVAADGQSPVVFQSAAAGQYNVMVGHRASLPLVTANVTALSAQATEIDFTTPANLSRTNLFEVREGKALMVSGNLFEDASDKGQVNAMDLYYIYVALMNGVTGYVAADINLDGVVNQADLELVSRNNNLMYSATLTLPTSN